VTGACLAATLLWSAAPAPAGGSLEYPVKAAFLSKFGPFVTWPESSFGDASAPFRICILGEDPFGQTLERIAGDHVVGGRPIEVSRLDWGASVDGCAIAYLAGTEREAAQRALARMSGRPILTVTDSANGDSRGIVHFVVEDDRVRFHIDAAAAADSGLAISSKLLGLALSVRQPDGEGR